MPSPPVFKVHYDFTVRNSQGVLQTGLVPIFTFFRLASDLSVVTAPSIAELAAPWAGTYRFTFDWTGKIILTDDILYQIDFTASAPANARFHRDSISVQDTGNQVLIGTLLTDYDYTVIDNTGAFLVGLSPAPVITKFVTADTLVNITPIPTVAELASPAEGTYRFSYDWTGLLSNKDDVLLELDFGTGTPIAIRNLRQSISLKDIGNDVIIVPNLLSICRVMLFVVDYTGLIPALKDFKASAKIIDAVPGTPTIRERLQTGTYITDRPIVSGFDQVGKFFYIDLVRDTIAQFDIKLLGVKNDNFIIPNAATVDFKDLLPE